MWPYFVLGVMSAPVLKWLLQRACCVLFDHVYLGRLAPYVFGIMVWSWPRKVKPESKEGGKNAEAATPPKNGAQKS
jgi:hypothetical protein